MKHRERRRRPIPQADDPTDRLVVREEAARYLEISEPTLRRRQASGELLPERVVDGVNWFSMRRLTEYKLAKASSKTASAGDVDGTLWSAAFVAFGEGATTADIVKTLHVPAHVARALHFEYVDMIGEIIVGGIDAARIRKLVEESGDEIPVSTGADIVRVLEHAVWPECLACHRTPRFCLPCFHHQPDRALAAAARAVAQFDAERAAEEKKRLVREALRQSKDARRAAGAAQEGDVRGDKGSSSDTKK